MNWKKTSGKGENSDYPPKLQQQKMLWLAGAIILGIALILAGSSSKPGRGVQPKAAAQTGETNAGALSEMAREEEILAGRLEKLLGRVEGAGAVDVSVRLASSRRGKYAVNTTTGRKTTEEKDQTGGARVTTENTGNEQIVLLRDGQKETPVVEEEQAAQIAGVLVVAEGARDPAIKARLFAAAQAALGAEPQKILVLPAEGGR